MWVSRSKNDASLSKWNALCPWSSWNLTASNRIPYKSEFFGVSRVRRQFSMASFVHLIQESGPCTVGDEESDPELMRYLGAQLIKQLGNNLWVVGAVSVWGKCTILWNLELRGTNIEPIWMKYCLSYSKEWRTDDVPRTVIDRLERRGYSVVCMTGVGQTCIWTLRRPFSTQEQQLVADEERRRKNNQGQECPPGTTNHIAEPPAPM